MDIARINIKTGEGFCRIEDLWASEGVISSQLSFSADSGQGLVAGQGSAPSLLEIPDSLPAGLKSKLRVICYSNQGLKNREISKMIGVPMLRVGHIIRWQEQITLQARAIEQYLECKTAFQVAQMLNVSTAWVKNVINKYCVERMVPHASGL